MKKQNVINLIRYHVERNENAFRNEAIQIARDFDAIGDEELAEYIKRVPIIALSGDDSDAAKEKFFGAGIDDFIEKPVNPKKLKKMLIKWLPKDMIKPAEHGGECK